MKPGFSAITSSKYYHPAFNSAIFDGPIRIYFVQFHETYALKIYFSIQERFEATLNTHKEIAKQTDQIILIMIYPTEESFQKAFAGEAIGYPLAKATRQNETVLGLLAPIVDGNVGQLMDELSDIFKTWESYGLAEVLTAEPKTSPVFDLV